MASGKESIAIRALRKLAYLVYHYPRCFFYPQALMALVCLCYTFAKLEFHTSRNDLVGGEKKYHRNFLQFRQEFPQQDDLVVVVESEDTEKNRQFVERLGRRLESETNLFTDVFYKGDLPMMGRKALLFVDEKSLEELHKTLKSFRPFLKTFNEATNLTSLIGMLNRQFRTAKREQNDQTELMVQAVPVLERIVHQANASMLRPGITPAPGMGALFGAGEEAEREMYITFGKGRLYLVNCHAAKAELNNDAVERLRQLASEVQKEVPGVNIGITGEPVLEFDEMAQSQVDTTIATLVSLVLVALIFVYGYQESGRPIKATICLIVGLIYTMGYTTLVVGHLNILTITFLPMLIGMGIDFGVHLVARYEEELKIGSTQWQATERAVVNTGLGVFTGCFTTSAAFFAMGATDFKGVQEMGIISGGGLLVCLIPMLTLLPVLLLRGRQNVIDIKQARQGPRDRIEQLWLTRPGLTICITIVLCVISLIPFRKVVFDYNLMNMQTDGIPSVITEKKLIYSATNSVLYGAVVANSLTQALAWEAQITNLSAVASVRSMAPYLTGDATQKLKTIRDIKREVAEIQFVPFDSKSADVAALEIILHSLQSYLGLAIDEVKKENNVEIEKALTSLRNAVVNFRVTLASTETSAASQRLGAFQKAFFSDIHQTFDILRNQDDSGALRPEDLPASLRNRFIGRTGKYLLQVFPKHDIWQRENQKEFIDQLRAIDPKVTGTPVQLYEYTTLLKNSYEDAAVKALIAIAILVFIHFRNLISVVLSLLPVIIGTVWMVGIMAFTATPFNPANIMTLPLVVGVGVTSGIHILNRFSEEQKPSILGRSTGLAVIVSALTTVAGFGSLILAKHQGIKSLGFIMAVGTTTCMMAALTLLPAIITFLMRWGWKITVSSAHSPSDKKMDIDQ